MKYLTLDEIKQIELEILIAFHEFCKKHHLYYTLSGGTLLGAIRHHGFIPWDDDIDVMMPREDYQKLVSLVKNVKTGSDLTFIMPGENGNYYPFIKAVNDRTATKSTETLSRTGLWIDIFPLDHLPADDAALKKLFKKSRFARASAIANDTDLKSCAKNYKLLAKAALKMYVKLLGLQNFLKMEDKLAQTYNQTETGYIGGVLWGYGIGERMKKNAYLKPVPVEFEHHTFNAPSCWEQYLTGLYGDYMQLPPEEQRSSRHHIKAWYKK